MENSSSYKLKYLAHNFYINDSYYIIIPDSPALLIS